MEFCMSFVWVLYEFCVSIVWVLCEWCVSVVWVVTYYTIFIKKLNQFCAEILLFIFETYFRYFSLRIISFRTPNFPFRFIAKQEKLTFCFAISLRSFSLRSFSLPFRFVSLRSKMWGHPTFSPPTLHWVSGARFPHSWLTCSPQTHWVISFG